MAFCGGLVLFGRHGGGGERNTLKRCLCVVGAVSPAQRISSPPRRPATAPLSPNTLCDTRFTGLGASMLHINRNRAVSVYCKRVYIFS